MTRVASQAATDMVASECYYSSVFKSESICLYWVEICFVVRSV